MRTVPITQARDHLPELVDEVRVQDCQIGIVRHNKPVAVLVSWSWFWEHGGSEVTDAQESGSLSPIVGSA